MALLTAVTSIPLKWVSILHTQLKHTPNVMNIRAYAHLLGQIEVEAKEQGRNTYTGGGPSDARNAV